MLDRSAAISSARAPVPSGELSSTIRTDASGTVDRIASVMGRRLSRSLYVGSTNQMRLLAVDTAPPPKATLGRCRGAAIYVLGEIRRDPCSRFVGGFRQSFRQMEEGPTWTS